MTVFIPRDCGRFTMPWPRSIGSLSSLRTGSEDRPLRVDEVRPGWFAVDGTPTDCVLLAVNHILAERPRLAVSGINKGANLGDDLTYSGTVSAAMEGTLLGIPSIAFSLAARRDFRFEGAARFARLLVGHVLERGLPAETLLNVNVPDAPVENLHGFAITRQGRRRYSDAVSEMVDPRGRKYYWVGGVENEEIAEEGTDFAAVRAGQVSVTPIHLDLTNYGCMAELAKMDLRWP
jgi:5'-nucleotidase